MGIIDLLFLVLIVAVFVWAAHLIITKMFPADLHMPLLMFAGVLIIIFLLSQFTGSNDLHLYRRWR